VASGEGDTITIVNTETDFINPAKIHLSNAGAPHYLALSADRSKLLVTAGSVNVNVGLADGGLDDSGVDDGGVDDGGVVDAGGAPAGSPGALLLLNATTGVTLKARRTDAPAAGAVFATNDTEVWLTSMTSPGNALVLTASNLVDKTKVEVGDQPAHVSIGQDGRYAFVVNTASDSVTAIDTATKLPRDPVKVGKSPIGAWQGTDGLVYVDSAVDKTLTAINTTTLDIRRTYDLGFTVGTVASGPDGYLWVTDPEHGKVVLFESGTDIRVRDIDTDAGAYGIAFSDDGKSAYVSNQAAGTVSVIDVAEKRVRLRLLGIPSPNWLVFRKKDGSNPLGDAGD